VNLGTRGSVVSGLLSPPAGYGDDWPEVSLPPVPEAPLLVRRSGVQGNPPFRELAAVLGAEFPSTLEAAWTAARAFWGPSAWDGWAGRAKATWDRWPSASSRRAVEEVVAVALEWERFWTLP
jgi:hypothetical protein